jgi:hypothetical protein
MKKGIKLSKKIKLYLLKKFSFEEQIKEIIKNPEFNRKISSSIEWKIIFTDLIREMKEKKITDYIYNGKIISITEKGNLKIKINSFNYTTKTDYLEESLKFFQGEVSPHQIKELQKRGYSIFMKNINFDIIEKFSRLHKLSENEKNELYQNIVENRRMLVIDEQKVIHSYPDHNKFYLTFYGFYNIGTVQQKLSKYNISSVEIISPSLIDLFNKSYLIYDNPGFIVFNVLEDEDEN